MQKHPSQISAPQETGFKKTSGSPDRVLRILHTESSHNFGGQELRTIKEMAWFRQRGHQVWLAAGAQTAIGKMAQERGMALVPMVFSTRLHLKIIVRLIRFCLSHHIDLIVAHSARDMFNCAFVSRLTGIPLIRYQHTSDRIRNSWMHRFAWGTLRQIATISEDGRRSLHAQLKAMPKKIEVLGTYVELSTFHPGVSAEGIRAAHGIPEDATLITHIGCIRPDKGQKVLVLAADQILQRHPNCWFMFVGAPTQPDYLEELLAVVSSIQHRDRIILIGSQSHVAPYIAASDIICLTSFREHLSQVIPQAFAMRKLVVASNAGGIPELVQHGKNGFLYETGNPTALADTIHKSLTQDTAPIKDAGFELAQSLDISRLMERTRQLYTKVIN